MIAISLFRVRWFCLKRFGLKPANQVVEVPLQPLNASEALRALEAPGDGPFLGFSSIEQPVLGRVWDPDGPEGSWERSWEALLEFLGKARLQPARSTPRTNGSRFGVLI